LSVDSGSCWTVTEYRGLLQHAASSQGRDIKLLLLLLVWMPGDGSRQ